MKNSELGEWLYFNTRRLSSSSETANLDVQLLAAHILGHSRTWVVAHPEYKLNPEQLSSMEQSFERLLSGEPLPYLLGEWEFYGRKLFISPDVLIPRPETELLVEEALTWLRDHPNSSLTADVGSGSGCIAVSLAAQMKSLRMIATDISSAALAVARRNFVRHKVENRVLLVQCDLLTPFRGQFDLICANLPYIPSQRLPSLNVARHEPVLALDGGSDGFLLIQRLLVQCQKLLSENGLLLFEIDETHIEIAQQSAETNFGNSRILYDFQEKPRLLRVEGRG